MNFQYSRLNGTPQKREQDSVAKVQSYIQRRLLAKVLNFVNRL